MSIPTTRTREAASITILEEKCNACGKCVSVCSDFSLLLENGKVRVSELALYGCIGCGHCMAVCPEDAIEIQGREISPSDMYDLPPKEAAASFEQLLALYQRRRSIRKFRKKEIDNSLIEKILEAAKTAPMGIPPSDVHVMVLNGTDKCRAFAQDFCNYLKSLKWMVSGWFLAVMRPFWGKANDEMFRRFIKPLFRIYIENMKAGRNLVNYDAPLAMYFYGSPYTDPADPIVAATYAMHAGESLGLGTCMLGAVHPFIQNGGKARKLREKYKIKYASREGLFVIFGYSAFDYRKAIRRSFAEVSLI